MLRISPAYDPRTAGWLAILASALLLGNIVLVYLTVSALSQSIGAREGPEVSTFALCAGAPSWISGILALGIGFRLIRGRGNGRVLLLVGLLALLGSILLLFGFSATFMGVAGAVLLLVAGVLGHLQQSRVGLPL